MSLIDEALRKASDQAGRGAAPIEPASWVPAYGLDRRARRKRTKALFAVLLFLAAAGGSFYWMSRRASSAGSTPSSRPGPRPAAPTPFPEVLVAPPRQAAPTRRPNPSPTATQAAKSATPREASRPTPSNPTGRAGAPPASAKAQPPAPQEAPRPLANGRTYKGEVVALPGGGNIALDGIAYSEKHPVAVINGRVVESGDMVEDFTVERIEADRVTLSGRGMTIFLSLK